VAIKTKQMLATLKLTRFSVAIGAIADIWLVLLITKNDIDYVGTSVYSIPIWTALIATSIIAVGICGFAASLNDTVDARHDATFHPTKPIPSGWIPIAQAVVILISSLLLALLAASFLGPWSVRLGLFTVATILFYNIIGKHVPAIGIICLGLIYASHMLIPNIELTFTLPVWLIMTHVMICSIAIYILEEKRPLISFRGWLGVFVGWLFWTIVLFSASFATIGNILPSEMDVWALCWPLGAIISFALLIRFKLSTAKTNIHAAEKIRRYGALWQCVYAISWLSALQLYTAATGMLIFTITSAIVIALVKEATGATGKPISWRR